jgi:hypothetical protein
VRRERENQKDSVGLVVKGGAGAIHCKEDTERRHRQAVPSYDSFVEKERKEKVIRKSTYVPSKIFTGDEVKGKERVRERERNPITSAFENVTERPMSSTKSLVNKESREEFVQFKQPNQNKGSFCFLFSFHFLVSHKIAFYI